MAINERVCRERFNEGIFVEMEGGSESLDKGLDFNEFGLVFSHKEE